MAGPGLSATYHLVWRCFEHLWPLQVHSMAVSRPPNCGMLDPLYAISLVSQGWSLVGVPSSSDTSGEQFGKDAKWHNIITCSSVNFASEASTLIWSYFSRHGDSCQTSVSASVLMAVMLMCSGSLGAGEGMLIEGTIVAEWTFWDT